MHLFITFRNLFAFQRGLCYCRNHFLLFIVISIFSAQQARAANPGVAATDTLIRGIVVADSTLRPLYMASIRDERSNRTVKTDQQGRFALTVEGKNGTIVVSHIGYASKTITIDPSTIFPLTITLNKNAEELGEVVVVSTGYEKVPQERSTGSFSVVNNRNFNQQVSTDVISRLEATANSFQVDRTTGRAGIIIRGLSTIRGPRSPLVIVDNFPYEGDINNINPNDVDNITILKDAAAASVWGARAGNGVIVITTKKGRFNQRTSVELNSNISVTAKPDLSWVPQISSSDLVDTEIFLYGQGYFDNRFTNTTRPPLSPVVEILRKRSLGGISAPDSAAQIDALRGNDVRDDFDKYFYQRAVNQQYSLNVRGGSEQLAWIIGAAADRNTGILATKYNRLNLHWETTWSALKNLSITTGMYYTESKNVSGKPGYNDINPSDGRLPVYAKLADQNGNPLPVIKNYRQLYTDTAGNGNLLDWNYYPLTDYQHSRNTTTIQDLIAKAAVRYAISSAVTAELLYQYERQETAGRTLHDEESYQARDLINTFSQVDFATNSVRYIVPKGGILDLEHADLISHQARAQLNFNKSWNDYSLAAIAGAELRQTKTSSVSNRSYGYNDDILTTANVDLRNPYPHYVFGWNTFIPAPVGISGGVNRFVSTYANASLSFQNKYTISASVRRDASNLFGVNTNDKWTPLWSSGISWDISKERFYNSSLMPYLRVRATYGASGNVDQNQSAVTVLSYTGTSPFTQTPMAYVMQYNNPELRWEKIKTLNIGVDFATKNSRVSGSVEYFRKKGIDLYGNSLVDYTSGIGTPTVVKNVASMRGNGIDVQLSTLNINKAVTWLTIVNASFYKDKITKHYQASDQGSNYILGSQPNVSGIEGRPVYSIFSYKFAGLDPNTGNPLGHLNGKPSMNYTALTGPGTTIDSLQFHGPALPTFFGSFTNTFRWKRISLTVALTYKAGNHFRRESINYSSLFSGRSGHSDFADRWQQPGDELRTNIPSMVYPASTSRDAFYSGSSALIERGDLVRLQYVTFTYDIGNNKQRAFSKMQVYINLSNLGIIWKKTDINIDPDYPTVNSRIPKTYAAGIRVNL